MQRGAAAGRRRSRVSSGVPDVHLAAALPLPERSSLIRTADWSFNGPIPQAHTETGCVCVSVCGCECVCV